MSVFLIAEAGVNHQGSLQIAKRLVEAAKDAGADAVKFQLFESQKLWGDDRIKHLELRYADMEKLYEHCQQVGIEFMCTPFGVAELLFLKPMLRRVKIASGCITRKPLLEAARDTGLPCIVSTGMSGREDIDAVMDVLGWGHAIGRTPTYHEHTLLHCTSAYPCRMEDVNLKAMERLAEYTGWPAGYSDHTNGITVAIAAAAMGATVIEKHMTLDRGMEGPDHKASITPRELKALRIALIDVEAALGDGQKRVMPSEMKLKEAWHGN